MLGLRVLTCASAVMLPGERLASGFRVSLRFQKVWLNLLISDTLGFRVSVSFFFFSGGGGGGSGFREVNPPRYVEFVGGYEAPWKLE